MQVFEYENKDTKEKATAVDLLSLIQEMGDLEDYIGVTKEKILDNWYELKRRLMEAAIETTKEKKGK